jgi:hypothetical protein
MNLLEKMLPLGAFYVVSEGFAENLHPAIDISYI